MKHPALNFGFGLLLLLTLGGCQQKGPLDGTWRGEWVFQGRVLDVGAIEFGPDYLEMAEGEMRREQLHYHCSADEIQITQPGDPAFYAQVRLIGDQFARMTIRGMNGYIELNRHG